MSVELSWQWRGDYMIPVRLSYRYEFHPVLIVAMFLFIWYQHEISYQYESYRWEFIPVTVLERHNLVPVRLSYRYDFHTGTDVLCGSLSSLPLPPTPSLPLPTCRRGGNHIKRLQRRLVFLQVWNIRGFFVAMINSIIQSYARNVRLYYPYRQYTNLFLFWFLTEHCLRSTLRLFLRQYEERGFPVLRPLWGLLL